MSELSSRNTLLHFFVVFELDYMFFRHHRWSLWRPSLTLRKLEWAKEKIKRETFRSVSIDKLVFTWFQFVFFNRLTSIDYEGNAYISWLLKSISQ